MAMAASTGAATLAGSGENMSAQTPAQATEFYQLRRYTLRNGAQLAMAQAYFAQALIPALNRMGMPNIGTFKLDIGPETPTYYVLIPSTKAEALLTLDTALPGDAEFRKASADFWGAPATATAFMRAENVMMSAFAGFPRLVVPKHEKRIFQLRTYESPGYAQHAKKVEMFETDEIAIFQRSGLTPVLFAHNLTGERLPSLTYMLTFPDLPTLSANWSKFVADPDWKVLSKKPGFTDPEIVSNISNLYLSPLPSSQI